MCGRYGSKWKHSKVIGYTGDGVENHDFKTWQPGVWNREDVKKIVKFFSVEFPLTFLPF